MPQLREIVDDLKLILTKNKLSGDRRFSDRHLEYSVHKYRARGIRETFMRNREINPEWIQDQGDIRPTRVDYDDDPAVSICGDCSLGKIVIPSVVSLPDHKGIYRVSSACRRYTYYPTTLSRFMYYTKGSIRSEHRYYFVLGNSIYLNPYLEKASIQLILDNPLEGNIILTHNVASGDLLIGTSYEVSSWSIVHNGTTYKKGDTFIAAATTFTGNGKVQHSTKKRKLTDEDQYPVDHTMMEYIVMKILTQEFGIEERKLADIKNDSQDEQVRRE